MRCSRRQLSVIQQSSLCVSVTYMFCESYLLLFVKVTQASAHKQCEHWTHTSTELPVCYGLPKNGIPTSKLTLSRWIVDVITVAYEPSDFLSPLGVKTHSTKSMAQIVASKAFLAGVPIQDICGAAGWSTPLTFVRFYDPDLRATPSSSVLLP